MKKYKKVILYKLGRFQQDFEYIFPNIKIVKYIIDEKFKFYNNKECINLKDLFKDQNCIKKISTIIVICDRKNQTIINKFNKINLKENKDYIFLEDFAKILDEKITQIEKIKNKYINKKYNIDFCNIGISNSEMFKQMIYTDPKYSIECNEPFEYAQIQPNGLVYPCCPDRINEHIGNLIYKNAKNVWHSTRAKIFRLSIINKTYAFCDLKYCRIPSKNIEETKRRDDNLKADKTPKHTVIAFDESCNLTCKSCRKCSINDNNNKTRNYICNNITKKITKDKWINNSQFLVMATQGEVFFSNIYQKILFQKNLKGLDTIIIHSNGTLFNKNKLEKLCAKFNKENINIIVNISLDSVNDQTYAKLRKGGNLNILKRNLEYISKAKIDGRINHLNIICVLQKENYKELPDIAKYAIKLKADRLDVGMINNWGTFSNEEFEELSMYDKSGDFKPELKEILDDPIFKSNEIDYVGNVFKYKNQ